MKQFFLFLLLAICIVNSQAQTGINFQGVARSTNNVIFASQNISLKLSILQGSVNGNTEYSETRIVSTNAQGLFSAVIGDTGKLSSTGNFTNINWKQIPKFLKIEMDPAAGSNFITMGTTQFQYVPYAQFAKNIDAENIVGIIPVGLGGTGVNSLVNLKLAMGLDQLNNTSDLSKPINSLTQNALDLKLNAVDTIKYPKQSYIDSALLTKLNMNGNAVTALSALTSITAGTASSASKLAFAKGINGVAFDGSKDITITADAGTLTGTILNASVTGSSLTNLGILQKATVNGKVVVGNVSQTSASALLEVNSTTQGFLPPRLTTVQRDLIVQPVAGLTIWNIDNVRLEVYDGAYWNTMNGKLAQPINIGDNYGGGKVAYIFNSLDTGYVDKETHGIIAASTDQGTGIPWFIGAISVGDPIITETEIGTGLTNTNKIIAKNGGIALNYAAGLARAFKGGGYTDWYLPSISELNKLYLNKALIGGFNSAKPVYWSSSERSSGNIWTQVFTLGDQASNGYLTANSVRAIRVF